MKSVARSAALIADAGVPAQGRRLERTKDQSEDWSPAVLVVLNARSEAEESALHQRRSVEDSATFPHAQPALADAQRFGTVNSTRSSSARQAQVKRDTTGASWKSGSRRSEVVGQPDRDRPLTRRENVT